MLGEQKFLGAFLIMSLSPLFSFLCCCAISKTETQLLKSFGHEKDVKSLSNDFKKGTASQLAKFCFNARPVLRYLFLTYVMSINASDNLLHKCIYETTAGILFYTVFYIVEPAKENKSKNAKDYMTSIGHETISRVLPYILKVVFFDRNLQGFILGFMKKLVKIEIKLEDNMLAYGKALFDCFLNGLTLMYANALENYFWSSAIFSGMAPIIIPLSKFFDLKEILDIVPAVITEIGQSPS